MAGWLVGLVRTVSVYIIPFTFSRLTPIIGEGKYTKYKWCYVGTYSSN